jgi:PAS domain S-box-containing protein
MTDGFARPDCAAQTPTLNCLLPGDRETARLARSLDWSATSLGPPDGWPTSLKTAASIVIAAGYPAVLLWGPSFVQIYNDGYRDLIAGRHPAAMGQPACDCWPETWEIDEPIYARVRQGETLTFHNRTHPMARGGYRENERFSFCYSPVRDENYAVAGVLVTVFETMRQPESGADPRAVEEELRNSQERLSFALEASGGVGAWNWDIPNDRFYCSARFAELFSVDPKRAAEGVPISEFANGIHPEDRGPVLDLVQRSIETGEDYSAEYRLLKQDGSIRWVWARGRCYVGRSGAPLRFPGVVFDITERKLAGNERRRSQEQLQLVIDNVPGLVSYLDCDVRYRFANRQYQEWFRNGPMVGRKVVDVVGEKAFAGVLPYLERALAGEVVRFEQFLQYDKARPRYVQVAYTPDLDENGTVRGIVAMVQDITAQKEMELALRTSEEHLQQIFAQAPVAVAVLRGRQMVFALANASYNEFFPARELLGRPLLEAVPEINAELVAILHRVLDTGQPFVGHEYLMPLDRDRDGVLEESWFTFVYQPLRELDGVVSGIVVVAVDVTTHVRARQDLKRANRDLEEFAHAASHDIQEPLRMVAVYTELLMNRFVGRNEEAQMFAGHIRQGVNRMQALIRDLLTYSLTAQRDELQLGTADLSAALNEAVSVLKSRIEESNAVVTAEDLPTVGGDTGQLAHVFQNLLSNALKYQSKEVRPEISISAQRNGGQWIVAVRDNGIGFDQKYAGKIFGLFKRLHKDDYPGTGLGLAICQRIVDRYGGRMWAESKPGQGATFFFALTAVDGE